MASPVVSNFWIAKGKFFSTSLFVVSGSATNRFEMQIYDCDGELVNELQIELNSPKPGIFELDQFLEKLKFQAGLQYGLLKIRFLDESQLPGSGAWCRIHTTEGASMVGVGASINEQNGSFFPITVSESRSSMVTCVNPGPKSENITLRLIAKGRTPEIVLEIPANGSRVISIPAAFSDYVSTVGVDGEVHAYLRARTKSEHSLHVQLIDHVRGIREEGIYSSLT